MTSKNKTWYAGLCLAAWLSIGADCGGCPKDQELPKPMTENRARELDPSIVEGIGVSTTLISGDCRAVMLGVPKCHAEANPQCFEGRVSMRVFLLPVNVSVPRSESCGDRFANTDLQALAIVDARSNDGGELTAHASAGRYAIYVSNDDRCAACGLADAGDACLIDVPTHGVVARDLVLDIATH
jgi:hypothetical protein